MRQSVTSARRLALLLALAALGSCDLVARFVAGGALDLDSGEPDADFTVPPQKGDLLAEGVDTRDNGPRDCKPLTRPMSIVAVAIGRDAAGRPMIGAMSGDLGQYRAVPRAGAPTGSVVDARTLPFTRLALLGNIGGDGWLEICDASCVP